MSDPQRIAADPAHSAWVAANAGAGKTKVLTDRVLRLLLAGTPPERILCLTFTRAAAAEMATRIDITLSQWATLPDGGLSDALARLTGETAAGEAVDLARQLFARVLDVPGGLKIQTIHAFCQSLLARFPLEAGIAPRFQAADERTAAETLAGAREAILAGVRMQGPAAPVAQALAEVSGHVDAAGFGDLMDQVARTRARLRAVLDRHGGLDGALSGVRTRLALGPEETLASLRHAAAEDGTFDRPGLDAVAQAMAKGSATDRARARIIMSWLDGPAGRADRLERYCEVFLTQTEELRRRLATKAVEEECPGALDILAREGEHLLGVRARIRAATVAQATGALLTLGERMLEVYERRLRAAGWLDYDDLIHLAGRLLSTPGEAAWVLYKLDGGLDHLLVDEAQDTNPQQWAVIAALTEEFFAGEGARDTERTVFAVGDPKQSIYGFQGADPAAFETNQARFRTRSEDAGRPWRSVRLDRSYRSTEAVLRAVDATFARADAAAGVGAVGERVRHAWARRGEAGLVELWPVAPPAEKAAVAAWTPAAPSAATKLPRTRLAHLLAHKIASWTRPGSADPEARLEARGRAMEPGDVLVLVRQRKAFVEELVRALKDRDVPVAGVDRMVLTDQLAVMDLVALGAFLLLPEDDLTLATVLKGPLLGFDEALLFTLAHGRAGTLWASLGTHARDDARIARAREWLAALLARADFVRPYELFADVLARGGRRRLLARLGPDAGDAIDEFLALALAYEARAAPSLQGFLHWLSAGKAEVKRELELARGAVRVMTVHGAKGLQAPVVILPDTMQVPTRDDPLLWLDDVVLWPPRRAHEEAVSAAARGRARERRDEEYRRLLYVAMTRAEDRLYVCGWPPGTPAADTSWYELVRRGLADIATPVAFELGRDGPDGWSGPGLRLCCPQTAAPHPAEARGGALLSPALPAWAGRPPVPEPTPPRPLVPSRPEEAEPAVRSPFEDDGGARFRRGLAIHRLLESLPEIARPDRAAACRRYLGRRALGLTRAERDEIAKETLAVLAEPTLAPLFGPDSRAEAVVSGRVGAHIVSGRIDRLLLTADEVRIVDYKTSRRPPARAADIPLPYLKQMAVYRALLREIFPDRPVRCGLVWTDGPRLDWLTDAALDAHAP